MVTAGVPAVKKEHSNRKWRKKQAAQKKQRRRKNSFALIESAKAIFSAVSASTHLL